MASELVERLAKRAERERYPCPVLEDTNRLVMETPVDTTCRQQVAKALARWWLNALADYFETQEAIDAWPYPSLHPANVADFLRDQVGGPKR